MSISVSISVVTFIKSPSSSSDTSQNYIRYDWPGEVPVTEWFAGSEQEVFFFIIYKLYHHNHHVLMKNADHAYPVVNTGEMVRKRKPRGRLLLSTLQDAGERH